MASLGVRLAVGERRGDGALSQGSHLGVWEAAGAMS